MNLFKFSSISFLFIFSFILATPALAAVTPPVVKTTTTVVKPAVKTTLSPVVLATVNIQDAKIVSQKGNVFTLSFTLSNREGLQTGVRYSVKLLTEKVQVPVDEQIYAESLTLDPNSTTKKIITYTAPSILSGTYQLLISSSNASGFPFGMTPIGNVTLAASTKGIAITPESCTLQIDSDKVKKLYLPSQGVDIDPSETLRLTCMAVNSQDTVVTATPVFETRYRSADGDIVASTGGDTTPISFAKLEKKPFSILLPKVAKPQAYSLNVSLKSGGVLSNSINVHYVIRGASATIQNLSLNKDYYANGSTANLSLIWSPSADIFARSRAVSGTPVPNILLNLALVDYLGKSCATPLSQTLVQDTKAPKTDLSLVMTRDCYNPEAHVTLKDSKGTILDQKIFKVETTSVPKPKASTSNALSIIILVIIIIIIIFIYMNKKKKDIDYMNGANSVTLKILFPLLIILGGFASFHVVSADTFFVGSQGGYATVNLDKSVYNPGQNIYATGGIDANNGLAAWDPGYADAINSYGLTTSNNGGPAFDFYVPNTFSMQICYWSAIVGMTVCELKTASWPMIYGSTIFTAPMTSGSYNVAFSGGHNEPAMTFGVNVANNNPLGVVGSASIQDNNTGQVYTVDVNVLGFETGNIGTLNIPKGSYTLTNEIVYGCSTAGSVFVSPVGTQFTANNSTLGVYIFMSCTDNGSTNPPTNPKALQ